MVRVDLADGRIGLRSAARGDCILTVEPWSRDVEQPKEKPRTLVSRSCSNGRRCLPRRRVCLPTCRVATMTADGLGNREIAKTLFATLRTVETHLSSIFRKLDLSSRTPLVAALGRAAEAAVSGEPS